MFGDGQAQSHAGNGTAPVNPIKAVEDAFDVFGRNPFSMVGNPQNRFAVVLDGQVITAPSSNAVIPNGQAGQSVGVQIENLDMRGASADAVARLEAFVYSMNGSIENRAVAAVVSSCQRGMAALR